MDDDSDVEEKEKEKGEGSGEKHERSTRIPITRVKSIMKTDPDLALSSQEAVYLITKATEYFIEYLAEESFQIMFQNRKKTLQKKDVELAIEQVDSMTFLEGALN